MPTEPVSMDAMYQVPWVQKLHGQIKDSLKANSDWLGIDLSKPQRVLDYACGNGTVSTGLLDSFPQATFHGLDVSDSQVKLFNDEASKVLTPDHGHRMHAIQGNLSEPEKTPALNGPDWFSFDSAIISFALHHVEDPIHFLGLLKARVKPGGTVIVVDWLKENETDSTSGPNVDGAGPKYLAANMSPVPMGKIWPGFSREDIYEDYIAAGLTDIDIRIWQEQIELPQQAAFGGKSTMYISKGTVPLQ